MVDTRTPCIVGVDGGGSSCRVALVYDRKRHETAAGAANVSTDREAAVATLLDALATVAAKAGLTTAELRPFAAYVGLAGVKGAEDAARVAAALPFRHAVVEDDRLASIAGALGQSDGTVAGIGTGSFLGRRSGGSVRLLGGWGFALGDEASAAWLGRALLATVLKSIDGLTEPSPLTQAILAEFNDSPSEIVAFSLTASPRDYGRLAPRIEAAARLEDLVAGNLMRAGAAYLERALHAIGWRPDEPLCLIGGVARHYQTYLSEQIARAVRTPSGTALDGALQLATRLWEEA